MIRALRAICGIWPGQQPSCTAESCRSAPSETPAPSGCSDPQQCGTLEGLVACCLHAALPPDRPSNGNREIQQIQSVWAPRSGQRLSQWNRAGAWQLYWFAEMLCRENCISFKQAMACCTSSQPEIVRHLGHSTDRTAPAFYISCSSIMTGSVAVISWQDDVSLSVMSH